VAEVLIWLGQTKQRTT